MQQIDFRSYSGEQQAHHHPYHQLILPRHGTLALEVGNRQGRVDGGHGALIVAGERHAYQGLGNNRLLVIDIDCATADRLGGSESLWNTALERPWFAVDPGLAHHIGFLILEMTRHAPDNTFTRQWTGLLLLTLTQRLGQRQPDYPARLRQALRHIDRHLARQITVREIADAACLGVSQLHALFQTCTGQTPQRYITEVRLDRALELLAEPRLTIADIALRVGYADQSTLTHSLRRHRGVTPGEYRTGLHSAKEPDHES